MKGNLTANINLTTWPFGLEKREYYTLMRVKKRKVKQIFSHEKD
jgi:hypothetical protein